ETVVHLTRDGHVVCFHDQTLERTTDGRGHFRDHTLEELRALDAAYHFTWDGVTTPLRGQGNTIPTFEEALGLHPEVKWNGEIRASSRDAIETTIALCESRGLEDRVLLAAPDDATNARIRRR